ncbi:hypothetical protein [Pelagibacterium lentulum]|uniref:SIR2-like domain-containing protein n=1 Tax=Pelagibacterium lentulum TaxID=2029865 RepID=A0A916R8A8_9HYPH|nr:hypothetical protein [Pelagibacterium lentulum]GGA43593.1 hypothetical protein GCM10011499_11480 [Pelagibacterium lentulum]
MAATRRTVVYVIGAGFSAGLGFPTISRLVEQIWPRLISAGIADGMADIIRFHHPSFNPSRDDTFVNVERLLSEIQANEELFDSSRPATGRFTVEQLAERRQDFLLELAGWFHELQRKALAKPPTWLSKLAKQMQNENAQIISFNWDLILDELLFGETLSRQNYGFTRRWAGCRLLKPHGSLNWYERSSGRHLKRTKKFLLSGEDGDAVYAFRPYRAPKSERRIYMPLIVPPVFNKQFAGPVFQSLWREVVSVLSTASDVRFLGYSLAEADFHARFILRCGFHNQESGQLRADGKRSAPTGRAEVTVVDINPEVGGRIQELVGWPVANHAMNIEKWVRSWKDSD